MRRRRPPEHFTQGSTLRALGALPRREAPERSHAMGDEQQGGHPEQNGLSAAAHEGMWRGLDDPSGYPQQRQGSTAGMWHVRRCREPVRSSALISN